jgi:hypothetical protein
MDSIFPGMDPFLELPGLWPEVHHQLISKIYTQLQPQITPRYIARITPYVAFEAIELAPVQLAVPDVGVYERTLADPPTGAAVMAAPTLVLPAKMELPTRYGRIEIRGVGSGELVTAIELLSPANKRPSAEGADAYEKKRQEVFKSTAHLLEIDLLRGGQRPQLAHPLPAYPYFILLSRVERRPDVEIWALALQTAIPAIPVPLRAPDPPVALDLTLALREIYQTARYDLQLNYRNDPPPPELSADDAAWLDGQLRERGLR